MMQFLIRPAVPEDAGELLEIYRYYVEKTAVSFEWEAPTVSGFADRIRHITEKYPYFCAVEVPGPGQRERILGYAYAGTFKSRAAYDWSVETTVYVAPDLRRRGVGRALYGELESALRRMGIQNMNACIALPAVEDATLTYDSFRFHERMGFRTVGTFTSSGCKFGRWYDMIWMEKLIGDHGKNPAPVLPYPALERSLTE